MIKNVYYFIVICCLLTKIKATTANTWPDENSLINESMTYKTFTERTAKEILEFTKYLHTLGKSINDDIYFDFPIEDNIGNNKFTIVLISYRNFVPVYKVVENGVSRCVLKIELCNKEGYLIDEDKYRKLSNYKNIVKCIFSYVSEPDKQGFKENLYVERYAFYYFEFLDIKLNMSFCISNDNCLDEVKLKKVLKDVLEGLKDMHEKGYVHGDLKLDNVLGYNSGEKESNQNTYKIIDFGLTEKLCWVAHLVIYGNYYTEAYRPPEISFSETKKISELSYKSDIWAFGCLAYYLSLGRIPFFRSVDDDINVGLAMFEAFKNGRIFEIETFPPNLANLILDCLKLDPKDRPTVSELLGYSFFLENNNSITD